MGSQIKADSLAIVLHDVSYRCQCHIPDMLLHRITYRCQFHVPDMVLHGITHTLMS
ncbi:von Willebrand factor A domain-containing 3A [Gossypium arboreum]|uniref:von Willebrand factor A domain-containing 3A n=1 Tax=Gossypium arboreum TaxID=29729 RepID=A0A0B0N4R9_GOSAR|nr:von Willebrand factor A domain-containing 3A [Gossypium arboreum]